MGDKMKSRIRLYVTPDHLKRIAEEMLLAKEQTEQRILDGEEIPHKEIGCCINYSGLEIEYFWDQNKELVF